MDLASIKTRHNQDKKRFELVLENNLAFIDYQIGKSGNWYLIHTEVPDEYEGQGAGNKIVRESLEMVEEMGVKVIPSCPFIKLFIKRHLDDYKHLLVEGVIL